MLFVGLAPLLVPDQTLDTILVMGIVVGIPSLYLTLRCPFVRVVVDDVGVHYHGYFGRRRWPWYMILGTRVVEVAAMVGSAYAPALVLVGQPDEPEPLDTLSGYSTGSRLGWSRMARQERTIAEWLSARA